MGQSSKYNNFENPFYSIHRDMAYCGLSIIVAALRAYEELIKDNPLKQNDLKKLGLLSNSLKELLVTEALKYENNFKLALLKSGYLDLPESVREEYSKILFDIVVRFIFESIREANYGVSQEIALARYDEAFKNLVDIEVYVKRRPLRKLFFVLVHLYFKVHNFVKKVYFKLFKKDKNNKEESDAKGKSL
jgi:hypothetical protein